MNKAFWLPSVLLCLTLTCCAVTKAEESTESYKILSLVSEFDIRATNGFDYSLSQYYRDEVVNTHHIICRIDSENPNKAIKIEESKQLNNKISDEQFIISSQTYYFLQDKIGIATNQEICWQQCDFDDFIDIKLNNFIFSTESLENLLLSNGELDKTLTFTVPNTNENPFLDIDKKINNISFEIKTDLEISKLISLKMSYYQKITRTTFIFEPYYGEVNLDF